jgi:hypothetical protein
MLTAVHITTQGRQVGRLVCGGLFVAGVPSAVQVSDVMRGDAAA